MTDKELDKLFREKFAAAEHEFQESSWEKAKTLIEQEDPAAVDDLVRRKFAAQEFAFNERSWVAAKAMVDAMYRRIWLRDWTVRIGVFVGVLALTVGLDSLIPGNAAHTAGPAGRPAVALVQNGPTSKSSSIASNATSNEVIEASEGELGIASQNAQSSSAIEREKVQPFTAQSIDGGGAPPSDAKEIVAESTGEPSGQVALQAVEAEKALAEESAPLAAVSEDDDEESTAVSEVSESDLLESETVGESDDEAQSNSARPRPSAPGMFNPIKGKSSYFGLSVGARIYEDYASTETGQVHISPTVGLRYAYMFHPKLSMNVAAHYSYRRSTQSAHQFTGASYSFGAHEHTMDMVSSEMHQMDVPLYIRYQIARGHYVYTGGYLNVTVASKNETSSHTTAPFQTDVQYDETKWGHMPGLREWGYGLVLGYDLRLNENWQIGVRGQWGLVDWSDDAVFVDSPYDRNKEIKLLIEYRLND